MTSSSQSLTALEGQEKKNLDRNESKAKLAADSKGREGRDVNISAVRLVCEHDQGG